MDRRLFLKMTSLVAVAGTFAVVPKAARPQPVLRAPGTYQIVGRVQLQGPVVEISGITNAQQISWSAAEPKRFPVAGFTSFESFNKPWRMPEIRVRGGQLVEVAVVPVDIGEE